MELISSLGMTPEFGVRSFSFGDATRTELSCCAFSLYNSSGQDARTTKFK
jgi:hypothetical protein